MTQQPNPGKSKETIPRVHREVAKNAIRHGYSAPLEKLVTAEHKAIMQQEGLYNGLRDQTDVKAFVSEYRGRIDAHHNVPTAAQKATKSSCVRQWRKSRSEVAWKQHVCACCQSSNRRDGMDRIGVNADAPLRGWTVREVDRVLRKTCTCTRQRCSDPTHGWYVQIHRFESLVHLAC
jgi:hypothetical protein